MKINPVIITLLISCLGFSLYADKTPGIIKMMNQKVDLINQNTEKAKEILELRQMHEKKMNELAENIQKKTFKIQNLANGYNKKIKDLKKSDAESEKLFRDKLSQVMAQAKENRRTWQQAMGNLVKSYNANYVKIQTAFQEHFADLKSKNKSIADRYVSQIKDLTDRNNHNKANFTNALKSNKIANIRQITDLKENNTEQIKELSRVNDKRYKTLQSAYENQYSDLQSENKKKIDIYLALIKDLWVKLNVWGETPIDYATLSQ